MNWSCDISHILEKSGFQDTKLWLLCTPGECWHTSGSEVRLSGSLSQELREIIPCFHFVVNTKRTREGRDKEEIEKMVAGMGKH